MRPESGARDNDARARSRDLEEEIRNIDKNLLWAVEQLDLSADDGERIAKLITERKGRSMSDGSLKNKYGSSAFTFLSSDEEYGMSGRNTVPGMDRDQSSYRSEMCGILGNLLLLNAICRFHNITTEHKVTIGSDSESALWNSFRDTPVTTKMASYDLVAVVRHQIKISPLIFESKWVKGHQDSGKKGGKILDAWPLANIECDKQASRIWKEKERSGNERRPGVEGRMPGEKWVCYTQNGKISTDIDQQLYDVSKRNDMIIYWEKKERIEVGTGDIIDWEAHNKVMKKFGPRRIWVSKHFSGWAGSDKMMLRWKYRDNAKCLRCDEIEDTHHVVQCQSMGNQNSFLIAIEPLRKWLEETKSPRIRSAVITHVKAYQKNIPVGGFRTSHRKTKEVSANQDDLGKRSFGEGLLTKGWKEIQMEHYGDPEKVDKSEQWVVHLINKIWEVSWMMWEARNNLIHNDASVRGELFMDNINATIEVLYEEGITSDTLFHTESKFFSRNTLHKVLQLNERTKVLWIETAEKYLDPEVHYNRGRTSQGVFTQWRNQA